MTTLSVVIPVYNEEVSIASIIERTLSITEDLSAAGIHGLEVLVVDDGSSDQTADIVSRFQSVKLIRHHSNLGYGAAIKSGFKQARGDLLAFIDADGTYPPESFPLLCRALHEKGADLAIGSRMGRTERGMPLIRTVGNIIFANLVSLVANQRVDDCASGQRILRRDVLSKLYPLPDGLNFTPVMTVRALHEDVKMAEVSIPYAEREGKSKLHVLKDGYRFMATIIATAFTYNPVRILGGLGLILVFLGIFTACGTFLGLIPHSADNGFPKYFIALVLVALGLNSFTVGTLFTYVVSLFHKRQVRQGIFGYPLFRQPVEEKFGWLGTIAICAGVVIYCIARWGGYTSRLEQAPWFWPAISAVLVISGAQLLTSWFLVRTLSILSKRDACIHQDLCGGVPPVKLKSGSRNPLSENE